MVSHLKPFRVHVPIVNYTCYEENFVVVVVVLSVVCFCFSSIWGRGGLEWELAWGSSRTL